VRWRVRVSAGVAVGTRCSADTHCHHRYPRSLRSARQLHSSFRKIARVELFRFVRARPERAPGRPSGGPASGELTERVISASLVRSGSRQTRACPHCVGRRQPHRRDGDQPAVLRREAQPHPQLQSIAASRMRDAPRSTPSMRSTCFEPVRKKTGTRYLALHDLGFLAKDNNPLFVGLPGTGKRRSHSPAGSPPRGRWRG
jgi:hypothetical protein